MKNTLFRFFRRWSALGVALLAAAPLHAQQAYPSKPITLIVPFGAGSGTDLVARPLSQVLTTAYPGAKVIIQNEPGASGMIGAGDAAKSPPDGYTLFITTNTTQSANPHLFKKLPYDPVADFAPVAALARGSMVLVVPANSPINTVADYIAAAKKKSLSFGAGNSSSRVAGEMFSQLTGTKLLYVPYKSNNTAVTDLIGGQIDSMFADTATALPQVKSGKLKAIAFAGDQRSTALPNLPTIAEEGVKGYSLYYWVAVYAPKGTPAAIVDSLNKVLVESVTTKPMIAEFKLALLDPFTDRKSVV